MRPLLARHPWLVTTYASLLVLFALGVLILNRDAIPGAVSALTLAVVVAGVSTLGVWRAGVMTALLAATGFAYALAQPYDDFSLTRGEDAVVSVLLVLIALVVLAVRAWGVHREGDAQRWQDDLASVLRVGELTSGGASPAWLPEFLLERIRAAMHVESVRYVARFRPNPGHLPAVLGPDGGVTVHGRSVDVDTEGLPTDRVLVVPLTSGAGPGSSGPCLVLSAPVTVARPRLADRRFAAGLSRHFLSAIGRA